MGVADKSAAKISRNSCKLKQSIKAVYGVADKSAAEISRNSRKLKQSINGGSRPNNSSALKYVFYLFLFFKLASLKKKHWLGVK